MAVATMARGQQRSLDAFIELNKECEQFIKEHKSTFKGEEKYRFMF